MAFASVGTLGTGLSSGNNQSTLDITTSATGEVGNLVVVAVAVDNPTGTGGASTAVSSITDNSGAGFPGGNTWTRAVGFTNTNGGAAQDGADISIWYTVVAAEITSGDIIRATFANATTSDATAMSAWEFTIGAGSGVAVEATNTLANDAAAAGSLDATTANIECLRIRATASESNSSTAWTKTAAFDSLMTQAVSGAGTSATEMGVRGEFDISTGTGSASAPTGGAGAVDNASAYVAFKETTAHVGAARFAGAGSFSAQAVKKPSEATFAGAGWICPPAASSLLHFNGTDGTQVFVDERGHTWTANGDVHIEQDQSKFGGTSAQFDGAGDALLGDGSSDFGFRTGDFTIDFWARPTTTGTGETFYDGRDNGTNGAWILIGKNSDNTIKAFVDSSDIINGATALSANQWYHIALTRSGTSTRLFLDGVQQGSTFTPDVFDYQSMRSGWPIIGGASFGTSLFTGFIDEFRVLKGEATWVGGFSPPTSPYTSGLAVNQNMAAQERLGGTGSFSADATITSASGTAHVGEARFSGASNLSANVTAQLLAAAVFSPDVRDDFNRADGGLGANWTTATGGFLAPQIVSNIIRPPATGDHSAAYWSANSFSDDQFSQCAIVQLGSGSGTAYIGPTVRHQPGGSDSFYVVYAGSDTTLNVFKWTSGSAAQVGSAGSAITLSAGDVLRLEASGSNPTTLIVKVNGVQLHLVQDGVAPFVSGSPGLNLFATTAVNDARVDNWVAGPIPNSSFSIDATIIVGGATQLAEARFAGIGNLSVDARNSKQAEATFGGAGSFSTNITARFVAVSTFSGIGSISINALLAQAGRTTFNGAGTFSVNAISAAAQVGEARFAAVGGFSANATVSQTGAATFAGAGSFSTVTRQTMAAQTTLQGVGSFSPLVLQAWAVGAIFAGAGNASFHGIQLKPLIPDGDSSTGGWLTEVDGLPLFPSIDEIVPLDTDYIKSSAAPTVDICKISLSNPTTGTLVAPVSVLYRYGKSGTDTAQLQVRLLQGTTMIAVWQHDDIASGFVTVEQFLTEGMISNITDWNDLFLEFRSGTISTHMGRAIFAGSGVM